MDRHFLGTILMIYGASQVMRLIFRFLFTQVIKNPAAAAILGG